MSYKIENEVIDKIVDDVAGEETTVYRVFEDGTKEFACSFWKPKEQSVPEPTQLDRIESMVAKSQEQIAQEARDAYTLELINSGII